MNELHSLLKRQLRRFTGETKLFEEQTDLLRAINDAYRQFDADRKMLEHSLELTSQELLQANAELSSINTDLEMRVAARTAELSSSEERFRELFEHAPVSIWEEDFSAVRQYIDDLRGAGVVDFSAYFDAHPKDVAENAARVKIVDVNRATLEMYQAENKAQLLADLSQVLGSESLTALKEEFLSLVRGDMIFETELINYTLRGERRVVFLRLTVAPGYAETWAKVFVGISDITERRQAEAALAAERDLLQTLMDNIPDTIYFKDTASRFTSINHAQARVLGVAAPEDAIGKTDSDFQKSELARGFYEEEQHIIESGEPLINRVEFNPTADGQPRWFSATKVPIKNPDGRVIGIVGVSRDITERKQSEETTRHQNEMLSSLHQITLNLLGYGEIDQLLNALVEQAATFLDAPYAEIVLIEDEMLVARAATKNQHHLIGDRAGRKDALLSWQAFDTREPAVLSDYANWPNRRDIYDKFLLHAVADFPILNGDQCLGVLALGRDRAAYEFTFDQIQFGRLFANLTALVLNNAQLREALREQSIRDSLTGLFNRRYMEETLKREISRVTRHLHPLGIIMIDIDHFKRFNDTHGHAAGDALLSELGRFLQSHIRGEDVACRYGGEEFILIMPDASLEAARQRAELLRQEANGLRVRDAAQTHEGITLSIGVAVFPQHGRTMETVLLAADAALYRAKQEGRDQVAVAETAL